jgi:hypothetical protein
VITGRSSSVINSSDDTKSGRRWILRIDVAVQSYRKPASLIYTLLTLKKYSEKHIDTIYINDDRSCDGTIEYYKKPEIQELFFPWKILVRENKHAIRWPVAFVLGYRPSYMKLGYFLKYAYRNLKSGRALFYNRKDIRYQWAIDSTDKEYVFIIHDDIEFRSDVVGKYWETANQLTDPAIVGDLGQCWRCGYSTGNDACSPRRIMLGWRPSPSWPLTVPGRGGHGRECRINEWTCLLNVSAARDILNKERCFFGNYDDYGDVGAYWFEKAIRLGYDFSDPIPDQEDRKKWYEHGWQGFAGHSVWTDKSRTVKYSHDTIVKLIKDRFGVEI